VRIESAQKKMSLTVEDNGPGVATEYRDKIFQRFYRVSETNAAGSGLGLAIVRELVSQCGGTLFMTAPSHGGHGFAIGVNFFPECF